MRSSLEAPWCENLVNSLLSSFLCLKQSTSSWVLRKSERGLES